jgi:hypothetical protein
LFDQPTQLAAWMQRFGLNFNPSAGYFLITLAIACQI